jgi:hypothetical protein
VVTQSQNQTLFLDEIELFSCIKYLQTKDLKKIFKDLYPVSEERTNLSMSDESRNWIIKIVLPNLVNSYIKKKTNDKREYPTEIINAIFLISFLKIDENEINHILDILYEIINDSYNSIDMYEAINQFLGIQHNLFELKVSNDWLLRIIEKIMNNFVMGNYSHFDYLAIAKNRIFNIHGYASINNILFTNLSLLDSFLFSIKDYKIADIIDITQGFLLSIYNICDDATKNGIKDFSLTLNLNDNDVSEELRIEFSLMLTIYKIIDVNEKLITDIDRYLDSYVSSNKFSSVLYRYQSQLLHLKDKEKMDQFEGVLSKLDSIIERYEGTKIQSVL